MWTQPLKLNNPLERTDSVHKSCERIHIFSHNWQTDSTILTCIKWLVKYSKQWTEYRILGSLGPKRFSHIPLTPLTMLAWQHAYDQICALSRTCHSCCSVDTGGGQRGEIKCHNESKRHNSLWSNALRDESCSANPSDQWRLHSRGEEGVGAWIHSNYSQCTIHTQLWTSNIVSK